MLVQVRASPVPKERKKTDTPNEGWDGDRVPTCTSRILESRAQCCSRIIFKFFFWYAPGSPLVPVRASAQPVPSLQCRYPPAMRASGRGARGRGAGRGSANGHAAARQLNAELARGDASAIRSLVRSRWRGWRNDRRQDPRGLVTTSKGRCCRHGKPWACVLTLTQSCKRTVSVSHFRSKGFRDDAGCQRHSHGLF